MLEEEGAEGVEAVEEKSEEVAEQFAEADAAADPEATEPPSVEDIAARGGWVPKEKFKGPADKWKPADQFLLDGHEIKDRVSRELREVRGTLDTLKRTSASIMADKLREQHERLARDYQAAVEKGDPDEAHKLSRAIDGVVQQRQAVEAPGPASTSPDVDAWVEKNAWFDPKSPSFDPVANERAREICAKYAASGMPHPDQLTKTETLIRREFPHLFDSKGPAEVNGASTRSTAAAPKKAGSYADMPKDIREAADDLLDRGLIGSKEEYAKHYFNELAKRTQ